MYVPKTFQAEGEPVRELIRSHSFGTLVTHGDGTLTASHVPMLFDESIGEHGSITFHLARANEQQGHLAAGCRALAIFMGPHAYISPSLYHTRTSVPTWNYAVAHAYGEARVLSDDELHAHLTDAVRFYESRSAEPWNMEGLSSDYLRNMMSAIVGFEIVVEQMQAKFKMSQNRSTEDRRNVIQKLSQSSHSHELATAEIMAALLTENLNEPKKS